MLLPLRIRKFWSSKFIRRRILSFGCAICCPSVTFDKKNLPQPVIPSRIQECRGLGGLGTAAPEEKAVLSMYMMLLCIIES